MENLIDTYKMEKSGDQTYKIIIDKCYVNYNNDVILIGIKNGIFEKNHRIITIKDEICYAFEFNLKDYPETLEDIIKETKTNLCFYNIYNPEFFFKINNKNYVDIGDLPNYRKHTIERIINKYKEKANTICTSTFESTLTEWVNEQPGLISFNQYNNEYAIKLRKNFDLINDTLSFISSLDYVLLSDNNNIKELFIKYKDKVIQYYDSCMIMDRNFL